MTVDTARPNLASSKPKQLGQLLLGRGLIQPAQLDRALEEQRRGNHRKLLGEIFVELRHCSEEHVAEALAESYGIPFARISPRIADPKVISVLPREFLEKHQVLPLFCVEGVLTVAVPEPADVFLLEQIERLSGRRVQPVAATARDIAATLQTYLPGDRVFVIDDIGPDASGDTIAVIAAPGATAAGEAEIAGAIVSSPADRLVHHCLFNAVRQAATDVHIDADGDALRVRYRIDGRLTEAMRPPLQMHAPLVERLKRMAALDPAVRDVPQEGVARVQIDRKAINLRVATAPAKSGEKLAIRIGEGDRAAQRLEKLGFGYDVLKRWRKLIHQRRGLLLVTGPAGSGKGMLLYSVLRELASAEELNLCTVEESIDCTLDGVTQIEVDDAKGLSFDAAIRAMMRQDPDVLMVSTLRDPATARLAVDAAMTGHLVISSLPTPDAPSAVARLLHMGLEPYAIGAALEGVLAQRLVRKLCPACKQPYEAAANERRLIEKWAGAGSVSTLYKPRGCDQCHDLGFAGRMGIHELLTPDEAMAEQISKGAGASELRDLARKSGMRTMRADGLEKVRAGITTLEEVYRAAA